jgi:hypothetical protein
MTPRLDAALRDEAGTVWPIDFAFSASFELPAERAQRVLPPTLFPLEPRPGLALLNLTVFNFPAIPELNGPCTEVIASFHVLPNLALAPALPRLSLFTFTLGATSREFLANPALTDAYPLHPEPLVVRLDRERIAVEVTDAADRPILTLAAATGVAPRYEDDRFYAQSIALVDGVLNVTGNDFVFRRAENQRRLETGGAPSPHAFFRDLDVSDIAPRACHLQMWSEPGSLGTETHYPLRPATAVRPAGRRPR